VATEETTKIMNKQLEKITQAENLIAQAKTSLKT
jgi:hypothetical protein